MSEPWKCGHSNPMIMCNICVSNLESRLAAKEKELAEVKEDSKKIFLRLTEALTARDDARAMCEKIAREAVLEKFEGENCVVADLERKAYAKGFKAAKEKAKGIAETCEAKTSESDCHYEIEERIGSMEP